MTPEQALRSATVTGAELLGWSDRIGSVETGKFADLIAVQGNPLEDVKQLEQVRFVMKGGVAYPTDEERSSTPMDSGSVHHDNGR
jgi:imidazolonepropionase-like amidohydrolase